MVSCYDLRDTLIIAARYEGLMRSLRRSCEEKKHLENPPKFAVTTTLMAR
jgi:hypothetical protein